MEESSTVSQEKKAKKQLFESTTSEEAGLSTSSQKTVIDNEPSTETVTLDNIELTGIHSHAHRLGRAKKGMDLAI